MELLAYRVQVYRFILVILLYVQYSIVTLNFSNDS